jgi:hypothetical protein
MINIVLNSTDCIETVLPSIEAAMDAGDVCFLQNINYLGTFEVVALTLLVMATNLKDAGTGIIHHAKRGFRLIGVDEHGLNRTLVA